MTELTIKDVAREIEKAEKKAYAKGLKEGRRLVTSEAKRKAKSEAGIAIRKELEAEYESRIERIKNAVEPLANALGLIIDPDSIECSCYEDSRYGGWR